MTGITQQDLIITVGQSVTDTCTFTTSLGVVFDPTTVSVSYETPSGSITVNNSPTKDSTGIYHITFAVSSAGEWKVSWTGTTGAVVARYEHRFVVSSSIM